MPLFVCDSCGCLENTAPNCSDYYVQQRQKLPTRECSECRTGQWHNRFPKRRHAGEEVVWPRPEANSPLPGSSKPSPQGGSPTGSLTP